MTRLTLTVLAMTMAAACQRGGTEQGTEPPKPAAAAAPAAINEAPLRVELQADGTLKLIALDKWGASLDTTYENLQYLENAVPTLERGLTPEQTAKLKAELQRLKAAK